jgi:hypothetical protein
MDLNADERDKAKVPLVLLKKWLMLQTLIILGYETFKILIWFLVLLWFPSKMAGHILFFLLEVRLVPVYQNIGEAHNFIQKKLSFVRSFKTKILR